MSNFKPQEWTLESEKALADCHVFQILEKYFRHPDGRSGNFYVCKATDWVQVAALTKDKKIILVDQFRFGTLNYSWELPGGIMEAGEEPIEAGLRELLEETGYSGKNARLIASFSPNPAMMSNQAHLVFVEDCEKNSDTSWDTNEEIAIKEFSLDELDAMVENGSIHHSVAINGIYFLQKFLAKQKAH